jgi:hypothetical protein
VGLSRPLNSEALDAVETLLSLMTPDPDRLLIWILIVAVFSMKGSFVIAKKPEEVVVGWAVVVFQKCILRPVSLCAKPRPSKKTTAERVGMCIAMVEERDLEKSLILVKRESKLYLELKIKVFYY